MKNYYANINIIIYIVNPYIPFFLMKILNNYVELVF